MTSPKAGTIAEDRSICSMGRPVQPLSVIVLDFETTGLSPRYGDRPIEVGAVRVEGVSIVDRYASLMNPGFPVSSFITSLTGIDNPMLEEARSCGEVMTELAAFIGGSPVVAHNARFDRMFLEAEWTRLGIGLTNVVLCSMLIARRLFPEAPNHRLETLVDYCQIIHDGTFHRALADAELTAKVWVTMLLYLEQRGVDGVNCTLMHRLAGMPKRKVDQFLATWSGMEDDLGGVG